MGREPRGYSIWGGVLQVGTDLYMITIRATAVDHPEPGASFTETAKAATREEAQEMQFAMIRELSARLTGQGHIVVDVQTEF